MRFFDSWWGAVSPAKVRFGLMLLSIVALVVGGAADDSWG